MADLSVLVPARNEEWLAQTVSDVLEHARGDTEVIVVLDGAWPNPPLPQHQRLQVVYLPESIGQRAATNLAARLSTATYVAKCDAHVSVSEGFDVELMRAAEQLGPDVIQIPAQRNLEVYNWLCDACGKRHDQAPHITACQGCGGTIHKELVWKPRERKTTTSWRLDTDLHFQYDKAGQRRQDGDICDVMTSLGAFFFTRRDYYWQLGGCDEAAGSWGQYGQEWACKAWLSGGRHVVNKRASFAHFFRVGGIGFSYPITGAEQERARVYHRDLWLNDRWPGQTRPLSWLIEKFAPLTGTGKAGEPVFWHDEAAAERLRQVTQSGEAFLSARGVIPPRSARTTAGIVTYTDSQLDPVIDRACRRQLRRAADGLPIMRVALGELKPIGDKPPRDPDAPKRVRTERDQSGHVVLPLERGYAAMFKQILKGLELLEVDVVFLAEHDVLYSAEHLTHRPTSSQAYAYNVNVWKVDAQSGRAVHYLCEQTSGLCADRALLLDHYRRRVAHVEAHGFSRRMGFEPGKPVRHGGLDDIPRETWQAARPTVDIRHLSNLTPTRWRRDQFRDQRYTAGWTEADTIPGWGHTAGRFAAWLQEIETDGPHDNP